MIRNILKSKHAKFVLLLGVLSLIITTFKYLSLKIFFFHTLIFAYLITSLDCNMYGKCYTSVYINIIFAVVITLFFIFDYFGIFKKYKIAVKRLYKIYEKSNNSSLGFNIKTIMFPEENDITNAYKNRQLPKMINKKFRHTSKDEEDNEIEDLASNDIDAINSVSNQYLNTNLI
jgi:hypothetical protein